MPHIRIRGIDPTTIAKLSTELPKELAQVMQTEIDNFTVERISNLFFKEGVQIEGDPMVEIHWFDRGQDIQNRSAKRATEIVRKHLNSDCIAVVFFALPKDSYYENGEHF